MPGHSSVLQSLGTFILWMGWYGFNAGSTLAIHGNATNTVARIFITTTLSASCGGITAVLLERACGVGKKWDVAAMCNGVLGGCADATAWRASRNAKTNMRTWCACAPARACVCVCVCLLRLVSITAGCATCSAWSAILIGTVGGIVLRTASLTVLERLQIDDPLDAFAVHGACGAWGVLACALFSTDYHTAAVIGSPRRGLIYGGTSMLGSALVFILSVVVWSGSTAMCIFLLLRKLDVLRIGGKAPTESHATAMSGVMMVDSGHMRIAAGERALGGT